MPDYTFTFDPAASGLPYVINNRAGETVDSGTLESDADAVTLVVDLPFGVYQAKASAAAAPYASTPAYYSSASLSGGGGGGETVGRGTLYLKATVVDQDVSMETWADGSGAPFALVLDTEKQGDTPIPGWADENAGVYSIVEQGGFLMQLAGKGTLTYDDVPTLAYIDMYHNDLNGLNYGWSSDGSENSDPFTPAEVNALALGIKDTTGLIEVLPDAVPVSLAGLVGDNYGDLTDNPVLSLDVLLSVTKLGSGARYTEADFA